MSLVKKRDGRETKYNEKRVRDCVKKAVKATGNTEEATSFIPTIVKNVTTLASKETGVIDSALIDTWITTQLTDVGLVEVAKNYQSYKEQRAIEREKETNVTHAVNKLINKDKTVINENANKDSRTFPTRRDLIAGSVSKAMGLKMLPPVIRKAHLNGEIHFHDLDFSPLEPLTNCCLIDIKGMLSSGFTMGNAEVDSPRSIQTATAQISQIVANVASSQYGLTYLPY